MYIQSCLDHFQTEYPATWFDSYTFQGQQQITTSLTSINEKIQLTTKFVFDNLNLSILCGEYIVELDFEKNLASFESVLSPIIQAVDIPTNRTLQAKLFARIEGFIQIIRTAIRYYRKLLNIIRKRLDHRDYVTLIDAFKDESKNLFQSDPDLNFLKNNLTVSQIDHTISIKKESLQFLILIKSRIEERQELNLIEKLLVDKCNFLIKKILLRLKQDRRNYLYTLDFKDKELKIEDLKVEYYKDFESSTLIQSEDSQTKSSDFQRYIDDIYRKIDNDVSLTVEEYYNVVKHFKDDNHSLDQINDLIGKFDNMHKQNKGKSNLDFDVRAYDISYNYMINNCFSLQIDQYSDEKDEIEINKLLSQIKAIQRKTGVKNYFPYLKYAEFLTDRLHDEFGDGNICEEQAKNHLKLLEETIENLYINFEWCADKNFLAFQLPCGECTKNVRIDNNTEIPIFLASAFILPINFEKIRNDIEEIYQELKKYKILLDVHTSISNDKSEIKTIKKQIDQTDRKHIEILSVFSAIVLFVSGNIQIFKEVTNISQALQFMLVFTYSLCSFILLLWMITRDSSIKLTWLHKCIFAAFITFTVISFLMILHIYPFQSIG